MHDPSFIPDGCHVLGDSAYPLQTFQMMPYKYDGYLTTKEKKFNKTLSSTLVVIEQAFGHLFGGFRHLKFLHMFLMYRIPNVFVTACILYSICVNENDVTPDIDEERTNNLLRKRC